MLQSIKVELQINLVISKMAEPSKPQQAYGHISAPAAVETEPEQHH